MKIRTRLALLFTFITAAILLAFAFVIYYSARENREREFYSLLKKEGLTKAKLFFDTKVDAKILQDIYRSNREILSEVEVAIYDTGFNLLYHDAVDIDVVKETEGMIDEIGRKGELKFYQGDWQVIGFRYRYRNDDYIITAAAYDQYGFSKLNSLLKSICAVFIVSVLFIYAAGLFLSKKAFDPVKEMTEKARRISATSLYLRINSNRNRDELSELADTFNDMLSRLENSFNVQKQFVYNISHELRTPLTAIIAELELSLGKASNASEYKSTIKNALSDAKKIVRLLNSLLDLAKASYDPTEISLKPVRIDEVLLDARQQVLQVNPDYKIEIAFEREPDDERQLIINGNEYLLKVAFANLMENGCKFSNDKTSTVAISFGSSTINSGSWIEGAERRIKARDDSEKSKSFGFGLKKETKPEIFAYSSVIVLHFKDRGIGISEDDLKNIFTPFYRGENKHFAVGSGIGLCLTQKIILLHKGMISVFSKQGEGTTFLIKLPNEHL